MKPCHVTPLLTLALALGGGASPAAPTAAPPSPQAAPRAARSVRPQEDWTTPSLKTSRLRPSAPLVADHVERSTFTREMVSINWRLLDDVQLYVVKPKGVVNPPVVLYLYGYPSDTKRFLDDRYCQELTRNGCAAVGFECNLSGNRYRMRPMRQWFVSELPEALATSAHDVQLILDYLATRGDLDMTRVGMFGQGSGGAVAVLAAAVDPRIKAVDLLNPWGDWPGWLQGSQVLSDDDRKKYATPAFEKKVTPLEPLTWLPRLKGRLVRLVQYKTDADVPAAARESFAQAVVPLGKVQQYDNELAIYGALGQGRIFTWVAQQLGATPARPAALPASTPAK